MIKHIYIPHTQLLMLFVFSFISLCAVFFPDLVAAETKNYVPLTGIPGVDPNENLTLVSYLNALYILTITVGALFGVIKIAYAGVKYAMGDIVTDKEKAKKDIIGVLLGLGILLATYVVLYTINPDLTKLNILENASSPPAPSQSGQGNPNFPQTNSPINGAGALNKSQATAEQIQTYINACAGEIVYVGDLIRCRTPNVNNASYNTVAQFDTNFSQSNYAPAEYDSALSQYNEYVAAQEYTGNVDMGALIASEQGATDVFFVVNTLEPNIESIVISTQQTILCEKKFNGLMVEKGDYRACLLATQ